MQLEGRSFTLDSAFAAARRGEIHAWLQAFLRSPGGLNASLADHLEDLRPRYFGPDMEDLAPMRRIVGPEPEMTWHKPLGEWENDIAAKVEALEAGWEPVPLVVERATKTVSDGNRRREALIRQGRMQYWTITFQAGP